jgi:manganese-dependent inorganic pyrophosphatase
MKTVLVTSYTNPDLDGVASSLALASYLEANRVTAATVAVDGHLDAETRYALALVGLPEPGRLDNGSKFDEIWIVDTHTPSQLDSSIALDRVYRIYDHHPTGDPAAFINATIINETVGAVATLVFELFQRADYAIPKAIAGLLYCGILSNTLNFTASATSARDHSAAELLERISEIPADIGSRLLAARSVFDPNRHQLMLDNSKLFEFSTATVLMVQIEGTEVGDLTDDDDFMDAVTKGALDMGAKYWLVNLVDVAEQRSYLATDSSKLQTILTSSLDCQFERGIAIIPRVIQRKTDLVPTLSRAALE